MRVALLGAGTMGSTHAAGWAEVQGAQVAWVFDRRPDAAERAAAVCGARVAASLDQVLSDPSVDVIDICLPTPLHKRHVLLAAAAGKHVVCEKPIALSVADAEEMIAACEQAGVRLFVAQVLRFFPEYAAAHDAVLAGQVGEPGVIRTSRGGQFPMATDDWYADFTQSGGLVVDMLIHDFDWLRWSFGEVERVYALSTAGRELNRLQYDLVTLRFASGAIGHVEGTWAHQGFTTALEVAGTKGVLEHKSTLSTPLVVHQRASIASGGGVAVPESPLSESPYTAELRHFADCLRTGAPFKVTPQDATEALRIALAAVESARTGQPVYLKGGR